MSVGEPKPEGQMALQSARGDPLAVFAFAVVAAFQRSGARGRTRVALQQEQAAEVAAENAQAVAARRKPHPQNIYALYLII